MCFFKQQIVDLMQGVHTQNTLTRALVSVFCVHLLFDFMNFLLALRALLCLLRLAPCDNEDI